MEARERGEEGAGDGGGRDAVDHGHVRIVERAGGPQSCERRPAVTCFVDHHLDPSVELETGQTVERCGRPVGRDAADVVAGHQHPLGDRAGGTDHSVRSTTDSLEPPARDDPVQLAAGQPARVDLVPAQHAVVAFCQIVELGRQVRHGHQPSTGV